ncbi:hypothetical protein HMPREF3198_01958 [Winkia neuii]|nr:hypothetical protein HMPREF3198_01958 [Winkia neuii]
MFLLANFYSFLEIFTIRCVRPRSERTKAATGLHRHRKKDTSFEGV